MRPAAPLIALVENDLPTNRAFVRLLRAHGLRVEAFGSAEELLERADFHVEPLDCILLDVDLGGMSGLALRERLLALGCTTPVIFITGSDDPSVRDRAHALGCRAFLYKPVKAEILIASIAVAIAHR